MTNNTPTKITFFKRMLVIIYECVLLFAIAMIAATPPTVIFKITDEHPVKQYFLLLYVSTVFFMYFGYCWTRSGQTLAMKAWRCKVSNTDGSTISWSQALTRYLLAIVSWLLLGFGFLLSVFRKDHATLHDFVSKSYLYKLDQKG